MTVNGTEHTLAGGTADSTVSIGTTNKVGGLNTTATDRPENYVRTLTNMAAGRVSATSTDGVNGSQLHAVVEEVNKTADAVNTLSASAVRGAGKNLTATTTNGERTIALSDNLTDMGSATFGPNTGIYPSNTIISKDGMVVNSVDTHTMISGTSVVIENGNILENTTLDRTGLRVSNNDGAVTFTTNNIYAGEQRIHGVAAGTVDTDAVNVEQLNRKVAEAKTSATAGNGLTVTESKNANGSTNYEFGIDPSVTDKIKANADAIKATSDTVAGLNTKVADNAAAIDTLKGDVVKAKTTVTGSGVVEVTSSANENGSTNYNVSVNTDGIREIAKTSNRYAGDDVVKVERWNNPTGGADLTTFKFDAEKAAEKINVAYNVGGTAHTTTAAKGLGFVDGNHITTTTDANGNIQFNLDASVTDGIATNANGIKANADAIKATNDTVAGLSTKVADNTKAIKANADGVKANADAITGLDTKVADNAKAIKTNADGVKANAEAIKAHDAAINTLQGDVVKAKTTVTAGNGTVVTTTTNPNGSTNYTLGLDKGVTDQIDNNSKGIQANAEAIKDLAKANNALATETAKGLNGLNGRVDSLASKVDANQKEARRGIASATALAALHPLDYNPEHKVDVMAAVGHYRGNTAVALGAAYRPNENVMFTVGASINGKDSAINAGVSYKVGTKDGVDYKYSKVAMQRHIDELNTTVAEQNQKIEQLNNLVEKLLEEVHQSK